MKKIYHLGSCSTNIRILKGLNLNGIELQDIKKVTMTPEQVDQMKNLAGSYEALFSRKAMKYRSMGLNDMNLTEEDYKNYIVQEYTFLKRPVAIINNKIFIGNSKDVIESLKSEL